MMTLRFDQDAVVDRLSRVSLLSRVTFAACCAERLYPAYHHFAAETKIDTAKILARCLDEVWKSLNEGMSNVDSKALLAECLGLMPEDDSKNLESKAYAEDAVAATAYTIRTYDSGLPLEAAWAGRRAYEAVDQFVIRELRHRGYETIDEPEILRHPICQMELARQNRDLQILEASPEFATVRSFTSLREQAQNDGQTMFQQA